MRRRPRRRRSCTRSDDDVLRPRQAEELAIQASNLAHALATRPSVPSIVQRVRDKSKHAAVLARVLWRLHDHPGDRAVGAEIERQLMQAGSCP